MKVTTSKLREDFTPFSVNIEIHSLEELNSLMARATVNCTKVEDFGEFHKSGQREWVRINMIPLNHLVEKLKECMKLKNV